jgi:hypothetical protein
MDSRFQTYTPIPEFQVSAILFPKDGAFSMRHLGIATKIPIVRDGRHVRATDQPTQDRLKQPFPRIGKGAAIAIRHYPSWARIREQNESPHWLGSDKVIAAETEPLSKKPLVLISTAQTTCWIDTSSPSGR